jgi:hypothetical protein
MDHQLPVNFPYETRLDRSTPVAFVQIIFAGPLTPTRPHADPPIRRSADTPARRHADTPALSPARPRNGARRMLLPFWCSNRTSQ